MISATFSCENTKFAFLKKTFGSPWEKRKSFNMPGKKGLRWSDLREITRKRWTELMKGIVCLGLR